MKVGLRRPDREAELRQARRELGGVGVVLEQPLAMLREAVQPRRREQPRLPPAASIELPPVARPVDTRRRAAEYRANRRAKTLREADRDGVEERAIAVERLAAGGCRVEEPCAVEMRREAQLTRGDHRLGDERERRHRAVERVLEREQLGHRLVVERVVEPRVQPHGGRV